MSLLPPPTTLPFPPCPHQAIALFGDAKTLLLLDCLASGPKRFCALQRDLGNLNPTTLTRRLKKMERHHLLKRRAAAKKGLAVRYTLTTKGRSALAILRQIKTFAAHYPTIAGHDHPTT